MEPTPKRIDLGVSTGPSSTERATIRAGYKKTEVNYAPDTEPSKPDTVSEVDKGKHSRLAVQREALEAHALPGGRNSKAIDENTGHQVFTAPHINSPKAPERTLAEHSKDFISHTVSGNRAKAEASRASFHAIQSEAVSKKLSGAPKGLERPCSTPGCRNTNINVSKCADGSCSPMGGSVNVQRPRG